MQCSTGIGNPGKYGETHDEPSPTDGCRVNEVHEVPSHDLAAIDLLTVDAAQFAIQQGD